MPEPKVTLKSTVMIMGARSSSVSRSPFHGECRRRMTSSRLAVYVDGIHVYKIALSCTVEQVGPDITADDVDGRRHRNPRLRQR